MPARKPFLKDIVPDEELIRLLEDAKSHEITDEEFLEQRVSFAFGNAMGAESITKESVRRSSETPRLSRRVI